MVPSSQRLQALRKVASAGIFAGVHIWPLLPFINDSEDNVAAITRSAADSGARFATVYCGVTLRQNQRTYFYQQLDRLFPGVKEEYLRVFADRYECLSPNAKNLRRRQHAECAEHGLLYRMPDIRKAMRGPYQIRQLTLF